jgi:hypothetical protein
MEYPLDMYDTPGVRRIVIEGKNVTPTGIVVRDGQMFMRVEQSGGSGTWHDIRIEIHGTGWPIPNAEEVQYVGTGNVHGYVWHVFYKTYVYDHDPANAELPNYDDPDEPSAEAMRLYTIFKYPIADSGTTELRFRHRFVRALHAGKQYGELMLWVLLEDVPDGGSESACTVFVGGKASDDLVFVNEVEHNGKRLYVYMMRG